jgi:hypothetical protein
MAIFRLMRTTALQEQQKPLLDTPEDGQMAETCSVRRKISEVFFQ